MVLFRPDVSPAAHRPSYVIRLDAYQCEVIMGRQKTLDAAESRTLLIRCWKAGTATKEIAYILDTSVNIVSRELRLLRDFGLISDRAVNKQKRQPTDRLERDSADPRYIRAMRICLRCGTEFSSTHCGNRLCKNCAASAAGGRAIR